MIKTSRILIFPFVMLLILCLCISSVYPVSADTLAAPISFDVKAYQTYNILSWVNNDNENFVYTAIERATDQGDFYPIAYLNKSTNTFKDQSVSNGHVYRYRARTFTGNIMSPYTPEKEAITLFPTDFRIASVYVGQIDLEWVYPELPLLRIPDYNTVIERKKSNDSAWTTIAVLPVTETTYRDTSIEINTSYYYRIRTQYAKNNYSLYFPSDSGINTEAAFPLNTTMWGYGLSDGKIRLEWDMLSADGGMVFLEKMTPSGDYAVITSTYASYYIDADTVPGSTYSYRLRKRSYTGINSEYTEEINITAERVLVPADLAATAYDGDKIVLTWYYPYEDETGFEIWRKTEGENWEPLVNLPKNTEIYSDYSSINGMTYSYKVRAVRGDKAFSDFTSNSVVINMYPASPGEVIIIPSKKMLHIYSRNRVPSNTTYTLEYRKDINSQWDTFTTESDGYLSALLSFDDATEYYFRLRANIGNLETTGPELHFYGAVPEAPLNLQAQHVGYKRVFLVWDDITAKEDGYNIYRSVKNTDGTMKRSLLGSVAKNGEAFVDYSPVEGGNVLYEAVAFSSAGESRPAGVTVKISAKKLYKDISQYKWANDAIYTLQGLGSFEEAANEYNFYPQNVITKGQLARMIIKGFGIPYDTSILQPPNDITQTHIYYKDLITAVKLGLMHPDAYGKINANKAVTRQEIIHMLNGALGSVGLTLTTHDTILLEGFSDYTQIAPEERSIIASFVGDLILSGKSGQVLSLKTYATKVEAAAFIYRTLVRYKLLK